MSGGGRSGGFHLREEFVDRTAQDICLGIELFRRLQHAGCGVTRFGRRLRDTAAILLDTSCVPVEALWTLLAISFVDAPCSSIAAAMAVDIPSTLAIVSLMEPMASMA